MSVKELIRGHDNARRREAEPIHIRASNAQRSGELSSSLTRLVEAISPILYDISEEFYFRYTDASFSDNPSQYYDISEKLINKLSQSGIQIVLPEALGDLPTDQTPNQTTSEDSQ